MVPMFPDEVVEHVHSVILVKKYFYHLQKLLQLEIVLPRYFGKLSQDSFPNLQPIIFHILQSNFGRFQNPDHHLGSRFEE